MLTLKRASLATVVLVAVAGVALQVSGVLGRIERRIEAQFKGPRGRIRRLLARTYAPLFAIDYAVFAKALNLRPEDEVLDVACGSGVFLGKRAAHVRRVAGLDHSKAMIDEAIRRNRDRVAAGTADFAVGDVTNLPWPDASFSVVTSNDVSCYEAQARPAIEEMYRVLRPGGRIVVEGDRRAIMEAVGFSGLTARRAALGYIRYTAGTKA